ncbi:MAG: molecular chaperone TorD family protein [Candidatus Omnitrophica bacterium]|nr:molecular chaperone TorD family protein [Candidatus Omnitrophota bacterium]
METKSAEHARSCFFFGRLFLEPPCELLLRQIVQQRLFTQAEQGDDPEAAQRCCCDLAEDGRWPLRAESIAAEYEALFTPFAEKAIPPYEAYWLDLLSLDPSAVREESGLFSAQVMERSRGYLYTPSGFSVEAAYRRAGFEWIPSIHHFPDHLACELEFMGQAYAKGQGALVRSFFQEHLGRWVFSFLEQLREQEVSTFYMAAADAMDLFLRTEFGREDRSADLDGMGREVKKKEVLRWR